MKGNEMKSVITAGDGQRVKIGRKAVWGIIGHAVTSSNHVRVSFKVNEKEYVGEWAKGILEVARSQNKPLVF